MVEAVVLYGPPEDPEAFERYYAETHTALAMAIPGLQAGLGSEQRQAAVNDIPNFATGGVTIFFAEID